jgi:hypothetical protein
VKKFLEYSAFVFVLFLWVEAYNHGCFTKEFPFFKWQPVFDSIYLHWDSAEKGAYLRWRLRKSQK